MKNQSLSLKQKVTVLGKDGAPIAAGTVESFRDATARNGEPIHLVVVREAGLNAVLALVSQVRPWAEGDPAPQERIYVDAPGAAGRPLPSPRFPVVPLIEPEEAAPRESEPEPEEAAPRKSEPEQFDLPGLLDQLAAAAL